MDSHGGISLFYCIFPTMPFYLYHPGPFSTSSVSLDSARQNLASSFVNGFVNTAFGKDKLLTEDGNKWLYKNKEHGMIYLFFRFALTIFKTSVQSTI